MMNQSDNNKVYDEAIACPHKYELVNALELLQTFSLFSNHGEIVQENCHKLHTPASTRSLSFVHYTWRNGKYQLCS